MLSPRYCQGVQVLQIEDGLKGAWWLANIDAVNKKKKLYSVRYLDVSRPITQPCRALACAVMEVPPLCAWSVPTHGDLSVQILNDEGTDQLVEENVSRSRIRPIPEKESRVPLRERICGALIYACSTIHNGPATMQLPLVLHSRSTSLCSCCIWEVPVLCCRRSSGVLQEVETRVLCCRRSSGVLHHGCMVGGLGVDHQG